MIRVLLLSLLLMACGKNGGGGSAAPASVQAGNYRAVLRTINPAIPGNGALGTAIISVVDDALDVKLNMTDAHAGVSHPQYLFSGSGCPEATHDINKDGIVDGVEGQNAYGAPLLALDGDILSQDPVGSSFPRGSGYSYTRNASLNELIKGLPSQNLSLAGRTFVVHGVRSGNAPVTASAFGGHSLEASVPIACGMIVPIPAE